MAITNFLSFINELTSSQTPYNEEFFFAKMSDNHFAELVFTTVKELLFEQLSGQLTTHENTILKRIRPLFRIPAWNVYKDGHEEKIFLNDRGNLVFYTEHNTTEDNQRIITRTLDGYECRSIQTIDADVIRGAIQTAGEGFVVIHIYR